MKYIYTLILSLLFLGTSFAYTPPSVLTTYLESKVGIYQAQIDLWWQEAREKIVFKLVKRKNIAPSKNYRDLDPAMFLYVVEYLIQNIKKSSQPLTRDDFAASYQWFEIVQYPEQIIATVMNDWSRGQTEDDSFQNLAWYIFGDNTTGAEIAMTSPVTRTAIDENTYETAFIMPSGWTMDSLPTPNNSRVWIRTIPSSLKAVKKFSGRVSKSVVDTQWAIFQEDLLSQWITRYGRPTLSQYDGPRVRGDARRNELWVELNNN